MKRLTIFVFDADIPEREYGTRLLIVVAQDEDEARQKIKDQKLMLRGGEPDLRHAWKVSKKTSVFVLEQYE